MKHIFLLLFLPLAGSSFVMGQEYTISGQIKNTNQEGIPYANVFLMYPKDSTLIQGTSANEQGFFKIEDVNSGAYLLRASYIGKTSKTIKIQLNKDKFIGALLIKETIENLSEVEVSAQKPSVERQGNKVIFNVENSVLSDNNTWEILERTPGVILINDELKIGKEIATIYLNNRKVYLSSSELKNLLEGLSGASIKAIEVIENPSADFDANAGAVLNIVTTKNVMPGYKGNLNGSYTQSVFPKYTFGTTHFFKTKKLNTFINYSISPDKRYKTTEYNIHYFNEDQEVYTVWDNDFVRASKALKHSISVVLDYDIHENDQLSITANGSLNPNYHWNNALHSDILNGQSQLDSTLFTGSYVEDDIYNVGVDVVYTHKFNQPKTTLSFNGHTTIYDEDKMQNASSNYFDADGVFLRNYSFLTDGYQDIKIHTAQIDFMSPLLETDFKTGAKYSYVKSTSGMDFFDVDGGTTTAINAGLSDDFKYDEKVWAGYVNIAKDWKKWHTNIGVRGEHTSIIGHSLTINETNRQDYFQLFPTLYLGYNPNKKHSFWVEYSKRISRPNYQDLNPFSYFLNENDYSSGNPNLQASYTSKIKFNYTFKKNYSFDLYYKDNGHRISRLTIQDNENQTLYSINQNIEGSTAYGLDMRFTRNLTNYWYLFAFCSISYEDLTYYIPNTNSTYTNAVSGVYLSIANYLTLSRDGSVKGTLGGMYISELPQGIYSYINYANIYLGLRKSLWNKRASISLNINDIFNTTRPLHTVDFDQQRNNYRIFNEYQNIKLGFTYKFGNIKLSENDKQINKDERDRL